MKDALLKDLINNGFDFLERAIQQFKAEPKYSVINFCAAIEILLKARLMHEHWSLVIAVKDHPDIEKFKKGDFKSINFNDLVPRIESVTGEKISPDIQKCFKALANHRNKMVHFFHEAHTHAKKEKLLEEIAVEQSSGWFFLRRLLSGWGDVFGDYRDRISSINASMKEHDIYLETVFSRITPEIALAKSNGAIFRDCTRCKKAASEENKLTEYLFNCKCRVCLFQEYLLKTPCDDDDCDGLLEIIEGDTEVCCTACNEPIDKDHLSDLLDTDPVGTDNYADYTPRNCAMCSTPNEVIEHHAYYICKECFYITDEIAGCGWCNELQIGGGDLEMSEYSGCEFCDGLAGHHRND